MDLKHLGLYLLIIFNILLFYRFSGLLFTVVRGSVVKTDAERICDVVHIAELVENFRIKTGFYPYQEAYLNIVENWVPVTAGVNIYRGELPEKYKWPPGGLSGRVFPLEEFEDYIESVLGEVYIPVDGRVVDENNFPTFYQYIFNGEGYYVSAYLENTRSDTLLVRPNFNRYMISSVNSSGNRPKRLAEARGDCK